MRTARLKTTTVMHAATIPMPMLMRRMIPIIIQAIQSALHHPSHAPLPTVPPRQPPTPCPRLILTPRLRKPSGKSWQRSCCRLCRQRHWNFTDPSLRHVAHHPTVSGHDGEDVTRRHRLPCPRPPPHSCRRVYRHPGPPRTDMHMHRQPPQGTCGHQRQPCIGTAGTMHEAGTLHRATRLVDRHCHGRCRHMSTLHDSTATRVGHVMLS